MAREGDTVDLKDYFTPNQVAQMFLVSPVTIRQWAQKGLLRAALTAGGHRRFLRQDLVSFAQARGLTLNWSHGNTRILIVDDDPLLTTFLHEFLEGRPDIEAVEVAGNGFEAGRKLHSFRPTLMLLDLRMPGLDGFTVCKVLKADPSTHNIRVMAMTGYPSADNVDRILQAGAEHCLEKPIDTGRLLELLRLDHRQGHALS